MQITLQGRRALVTGANSGIGQAIAMALGEAGADVAVNYVVDPDAAEEVADYVRRAGPRSMAVHADVSDVAQVEAMFQQLDKSWGGLDILVNNAGIDGDRALAWDADPAKWRRVIEINLLGAFHCAREALHRMVAQRAGVVLNLTSVHEEIPWSGYSAYTASKAGLGMVTKTMAQEAAPHGVRVVALAPGAIKTPINKSVWSNPSHMKDLLEKIPLKRIGSTDDIAHMAVVLVSDAASYLTGTTVFVDGGMTDFPDFAHGG
jgi:NAD(P)-dependent dehydrogenase (short-subunit alcohol dehydrogenase family)